MMSVQINQALRGSLEDAQQEIGRLNSENNEQLRILFEVADKFSKLQADDAFKTVGQCGRC